MAGRPRRAGVNSQIADDSGPTRDFQKSSAGGCSQRPWSVGEPSKLINMGINTWWTQDTGERYWMEINNRDSVGKNLIAPKVNDRGLSEWSYETVSHVRPGDVVLHWRKTEGSALTGYSHCSVAAFDFFLKWQSRGTYGRTHAFVGEEEAWEALLQGYREFERPVDLARIRQLELAVRSVRDDLTATYGSPLYFPFALSDRRPIRAAQAYLVKFPAALVEAIPELRELEQVAVDEPHRQATARKVRSKKSSTSGYGRQRESELRRAIERYSVQQVLDHYESLGYLVEDVGTTGPWDITATRGTEVLHIEVKGSTTDRLAIDITEGEVRHAEDRETILIVIDQIRMNDSLECSGGRWRYWLKWVPDRDTLLATAYRYPLAAEGMEGKPHVASPS